MDNLEAEIIKQFSKLAPLRSKTLFVSTKTTAISFTFGNWALPFLRLLKKIRILSKKNCDGLRQYLS